MKKMYSQRKEDDVDKDGAKKNRLRRGGLERVVEEKIEHKRSCKWDVVDLFSSTDNSTSETRSYKGRMFTPRPVSFQSRDECGTCSVLAFLHPTNIVGGLSSFSEQSAEKLGRCGEGRGGWRRGVHVCAGR